METKHEKEDRGVAQKPLDHSSNAQRVQTVACVSKRRSHSVVQAPVKAHYHFATEPGSYSSSIPGTERPGIFFESDITSSVAASVFDGIELYDQRHLDEFHDGEAEDIFTLYNACDGAVRGGFLDIRRLDELSAEELEFLDVERLREIWLHTTSGCATCAEIIDTLNSIRGTTGSSDEVGFESIQTFEGQTH